MKGNVDTNKDNIKGKVVISKKYLNIGEDFKVKFIINKEILKYEEDLIAFIEVMHEIVEEEDLAETFLSSTAHQVKVNLKDYKEHDEENICYEVDLCVPDYKGYFEHINKSVQPKLNFKGFAPFTEDTYDKKQCFAGIMRESQLKEPRFARVISKKKILMNGEKSSLYNGFVTFLIFLFWLIGILYSNVLLINLPFDFNLNTIITVGVLIIYFLIVPKVINFVFRRKK